MRRFERLMVALLGLLVTAGALAGESVVLRTHVVMDTQGFQEEALRLLVPKGWRFDGGVTWDLSRFPAEAFTSYSITSADGSAEYQQFPHLSLFWADEPMLQSTYQQNGFQISPPIGAEEALREHYLANYRPEAEGAAVLDVKPLPELAQGAARWQRALMEVFARISPPSFQYDIQADAAIARFRYTMAGKPIIEHATVAIIYFTTYMPSIYGGIPSTTWWVAPISFRAPAAQIEARLEAFRTIAASVRENPAWHEHNMTLAAVVTRERLRQEREIHRRFDEIRRSQSQMSDQLFESWQRRNQAQDRIFELQSQVTRGVETYSDPVSTREVELPHGYRHAWSNGSDYVLSDDPGFNPNTGGGGTWTEIHPSR